jgi:hypothetical protein
MRLLVGQWRVTKQKFIAGNKETISNVENQKMILEFRANGVYAQHCPKNQPGCKVTGKWRLDSTRKAIEYFSLTTSKKYSNDSFPDHTFQIINLTKNGLVYQAVDRIIICEKINRTGKN